jgi:hypothetical protein
MRQYITGSIKLNDPLGFVIVVATVVFWLNKLILTGFLAITCPITVRKEELRWG